MRTVEEIENDINNLVNNYAEDRLWLEWFRTVAQNIPQETLKTLCQAWRNGRVVALPCKECDRADTDGICFAEYCEELIEQPKKVEDDKRILRPEAEAALEMEAGK